MTSLTQPPFASAPLPQPEPEPDWSEYIVNGTMQLARVLQLRQILFRQTS